MVCHPKSRREKRANAANNKELNCVYDRLDDNVNSTNALALEQHTHWLNSHSSRKINICFCRRQRGNAMPWMWIPRVFALSLLVCVAKWITPISYLIFTQQTPFFVHQFLVVFPASVVIVCLYCLFGLIKVRFLGFVMHRLHASHYRFVTFSSLF